MHQFSNREHFPSAPLPGTRPPHPAPSGRWVPVPWRRRVGATGQEGARVFSTEWPRRRLPHPQPSPRSTDLHRPWSPGARRGADSCPVRAAPGPEAAGAARAGGAEVTGVPGGGGGGAAALGARPLGSGELPGGAQLLQGRVAEPSVSGDHQVGWRSLPTPLRDRRTAGTSRRARGVARERKLARSTPPPVHVLLPELPDLLLLARTVRAS